MKPLSLNEETIRQIAASQPGVIAVYLFGSHAHGKATTSSDVDLGFLCIDKNNFDFLKFSALIERKLSLPKLDITICDLNDKPLLLIRIMKGRVIYQRNPNERAIAERKIIKLYEDYLHLQKIRSIYLDKSFKEGVYAA